MCKPWTIQKLAWPWKHITAKSHFFVRQPVDFTTHIFWMGHADDIYIHAHILQAKLWKQLGRVYKCEFLVLKHGCVLVMKRSLLCDLNVVCWFSRPAISPTVKLTSALKTETVFYKQMKLKITHFTSFYKVYLVNKTRYSVMVLCL